METVLDSVGRELRITLDFGTKRIFVTSHRHLGGSTVIATLTAKQALKLAAIMVGHVRHVLGPDAADPD